MASVRLRRPARTVGTDRTRAAARAEAHRRVRGREGGADRMGGPEAGRARHRCGRSRSWRTARWCAGIRARSEQSSPAPDEGGAAGGDAEPSLARCRRSNPCVRSRRLPRVRAWRWRMRWVRRRPCRGRRSSSGPKGDGPRPNADIDLPRVRLAPTILRAETAAVAAGAVLVALREGLVNSSG